MSSPDINFDTAFAALGFDPFASEENFLLGAFVFEDVGVTSYNGGAPLIVDKGILSAAASILAVEAYHASLVRTVLYALGQSKPARLASVAKISAARNAVDGSGQKDQSIDNQGDSSNIVPTDAQGLAFARTTTEVLRIVYLSADGKPGGFFPKGLNGEIR